jgi:hypothetical protein
MAILFISIGIIIFIHFTNDHKECKIISETTFGINGEKIITDKHICYEKYNL